ncbi:unnamed protein product [Closterium sp. NIES-53]
MGEQESATVYCKRARRILAKMRMAGAECSTVSYITHVLKGLPRSYNLMKRMTMVPGTRESLDEDSLTSYILQDEAMQGAEQPTDLLPLASYAVPMKLNRHQEQRKKPGGGGSGWGRPTKDVDEKRSTRDKGRGGGGRRRECWICHDPDHHSYECPDRDDSDEDDTKGGHGRSTSRHPRQDAKPRKEKQTSLTKDVDNSSGKSRGDGEALCSMVGVVELTVSLALEAGEDFQAVAAALHARLTHVGVDTIKSLAKHEVSTGLNIKPLTGADPPCVLCIAGKLARYTFPDKGSNAEEALAVVHIELCGPFWVAAKDGSLYFLLLKDHHTRFVWVMPVAKKSNMLQEFQKEFLGKEFTEFIDDKGIVHDLTCPYTPQQNGMAEREMCTAVESVRTMLLHVGVQHHWWHLALRQAVWVRNCLERSTTPPGTTPYQLLTGKKPDLTLVWVWGCMVQFMVPEQQRGGKLAPKAHWGLLLGVSPKSKGWEVLNLTNNKVVTSVEVIFYETLSLEVWKAKYGPTSRRTHAHPPMDTSTATVPLLTRVDKPADEDVLELVDGLAVDEEGELSTGEESTNSDVVEVPIMKPELRCTGRARRPPEWLSFHACLPPAAFTTVYDEVDDDLLYDDAEEDEELRSSTPTCMPTPNTAGTSPRGWLVVKGFTQVCGADHDETYSLVSSYVTLRIFLSIVAVLGLNLMQLDIKNAFLQSKLDKGLYMYQPDYFDDGTGRALYFKAGNNGVTCWVLVYVDDLLAASSSPTMLKELKELLKAAFELREILPVIKYLGLEIVRDRPARKLWPHQQGYVDKLRRRFIDEEQGGRVPKTPVSVNAYSELTFNDEEAQEREEEEYWQKVGSLQCQNNE